MSKKKLVKWYFHVPGAVYAYDIWAGPSERSARQAIREFYKIDRLPKGLPIWKA